ncbi:hypothetical protein COCOBI_12-4480 [Coccomyxa sp. Obi]|nr:hypothetical protein COCOBI_12-4480 [Coccomyxa sp. Obi]
MVLTMRKHHSGMLIPRAVRVTREQTNRNKCPQLPQDLWELITQKMPIKDWVKVSTACKALYEVQPRLIQVVAHGPSGLRPLRWLCNHWFNVSEMAVEINVTVPDVERFIQEASSAAPSGQLQKLHMACSITMINDSPCLQAWMKRVILAHADNLKVLSLHLGIVLILPTLPRLKNLVLCTTRNLSKEEIHCISQLPSLTSLWLGSEGVGKQAKVYEVDLALCPQLQRVCFSTTLPTVIRLPATCKLGIRSTARQAMANSDMWRERCSLLDLHLNHQVEWVAWQPEFCTFLGTPGLPPFLLLTSLTLRAETLGHHTNYLVICGSHLPNLTELRLRCLAMYLRLEASNRLKTISLSVEFAMRMDVTDYPALCSQLERIRFYSPVEYCQGAVASIGRGLEHSGRFPSEARWTLQRMEVLNNCGKPKIMGLLAFPRDAVNDGDARQCKCQSCAACLFGV